jgi:hypothetical protein
VEEPLPDDPFELRDLLADGRLRIAQLARRAAERPSARDSLQGREMSQIDAQPSISAHYRYER